MSVVKSDGVAEVPDDNRDEKRMVAIAGSLYWGPILSMHGNTMISYGNHHEPWLAAVARFYNSE